MKYIILLLLCIFLSTLDLCSSSVLLTSAPYNIVATTNTVIGTVIIVSVVGFYVLGLVVLIFAIGFASKEAKASAFDELRKEQEGGSERSVRSANEETSIFGSYLNSVLNIGTSHCLAKFICELETDSFWQEQREEKFLIDIFGDYFINNMLEEGKYKSDLKRAKMIGRQTKSTTKLCKNSFYQCGFSLQDLFEAWKMTLSLRRMFNF